MGYTLDEEEDADEELGVYYQTHYADVLESLTNVNTVPDGA